MKYASMNVYVHSTELLETLGHTKPTPTGRWTICSHTENDVSSNNMKSQVTQLYGLCLAVFPKPTQVTS